MRQLVEDAKAIFGAAVRGVQADRLLGEGAWPSRARRPLEAYRHVRVAGMGKAAMAMAGVVEQQLGDRITEGAVVVKQGYPASFPATLPRPQGIAVLEGGHPVPDRTSVQAARHMLALAERCAADDLLLVLVSGGGSALCADFVEVVTLEDAQETFQLLLAGGADIHAMNTVRKHLSRIGGGRLAWAAAPAEVLALVVSDVVGDDLSVIASGPTVPDPTTFGEAIRVLQEHGLWERVPGRVRDHLQAGNREPALETPKPGDPLFAQVRTVLVGSNRDALQAARAAAQERGYQVRLAEEATTGEARDVGRRLGRAVLDVPPGPPVCLLWGGETTVTVQGNGQGGRNQEMALAAALALDGAPHRAVFLSGGTDGIDGPTDAAGAWATPHTVREARRRGLEPEAYLADNDAYHFFEALDALLFTGPTHTNVMDVQVALVRPG